MEADLGVVKGAKEVGGSLVRRRFGRGENFLGNDGRRGLNLFFNGFLLSTSLRSVSSMLLSPNLVSSSSSVRSLYSSSSVLSSSTGVSVVDLLLANMFLILSCSFLVLSGGVVRGVATVVDLARAGLRGKNGLRDGNNLPEDVTDLFSSSSDWVVMAGVTPSCILVVPR